MARRYHLYQPFIGEVVTGAESSFEQVAVSLKDLNQLQRQIGMVQAVNITALFGDRRSIVDVARKLLASAPGESSTTAEGDDVVCEDFNLPPDESSKHGSLYAVVKGSQVLLMVVADPDFLSQKETFNKEHILVTLFRYLEDSSPIILLCSSQASIETFSSGPKNPFSSIAHKPAVFKLEGRKALEKIKEMRINTSTDLLTRSLGENALRHLVLNSNGSRHFLHYDLQDMSTTVSVDDDAIMRNLMKPVFFKNWQTSPYSSYSSPIQSEIKAIANELSNNCIQTLQSEYRRFVEKLYEFRRSFWWTLRNQLVKTGNALRKKKYNLFKSVIDTFWPDNLYNNLVDFLCDHLIYGVLDSFNAEKNIFKCDSKKSLREFVEHSANFFFANLKLREHTTLETIGHDIYAEFNAVRFHETLSNQGQNIISAVRRLQSDCKSAFINEQKQQKTASILKLTPCALNVSQTNEGVFEALTFTPSTWTSDITAEVFFKLIPAALRKGGNRYGVVFGELGHKETVPDEVIRTTRITSCYALWNGKLFIITLQSDRLPGLTILASVSSAEVKGLKTWPSNNLVLAYEAGEKSSDSAMMAVIAYDGDVSLFEFSQSESVIKPTLKDTVPIPTQVRGKVVSSAIFSSRHEMLLLTDNGYLYLLNLVKKEFTELCRSTSTDGIVERKKITTSNGSPYQSVHLTKNSDFFIMCGESSTDIYNLNVEKLISLPTTRCHSVKIYWDNANVYLSLLQETKHENVSSFVFLGLCSDVTLRRLSDELAGEKEVCQGNPIIDTIYASFLKYGPQGRFIGSPESVDYRLVVPGDGSIESIESILNRYLNTFSPKLVVKIEQLTKLAPGSASRAMQSERLRSILVSRVPLHICTIEENNVVPLVDGRKWNQVGAPEVVSDIANLADRITFGHLESILSTFPSDRPIKIVSIIGRQSSGKSYLLNRLFGTRFSVAATRCTDGIWISYARLFCEEDGVERDFIILDCEGLFSISRNELEEVKLLTILSAVSDITILNQDLAFSRHMSQLFSDLNSTVDRVKGKNYFRGLLMMAVRDVASEENEKTAQEFQRNMVALNQKGDHQFLQRLFSGVVILQCLNNYKNRDAFMAELENLRASLFIDRSKDLGLTSAQRWADAMTLLQSLKIVLLQVNRDDEQAGDEHVKRVKMLQVESRIISAWGDMSKTEGAGQTCLVKKPGGEEVTVAQKEIVFPCPSDQLETEDITYEVISKELTTRFFGNSKPKIPKLQHNETWFIFNQLLTNFVTQRIAILQEYAEREIATLERMLTVEERRNFQTGIQEKIRSLGAQFELCMNKCTSCHLKCTERKGHNEATFETRTKLEQRLKELRAKLPTDMQLEISDTERQLASTKLQYEEVKRIRSDLEKLIANARAKEAAHNRQDQLVKLLAEKENEENETIALISELSRVRGQDESGDDFALPLAQRKTQLCKQLRTFIEHLLESDSSVVAGLRRRFADLTVYSAPDSLLAKLEQQLLDCANWFDSILANSKSESEELELHFSEWSRYLEGFSQAQLALDNCDRLLAGSLEEEANANRMLADEEKEMATFESAMRNLNEKKEELQREFANVREKLSLTKSELERLRNENARLTKLEASCSAAPSLSSATADDGKSVAKEDDNGSHTADSFDFCMLPSESLPAPSPATLPIVNAEEVNQQLATVVRRLTAETGRLEKYESTGLDSDEETVSESRLKSVREKVEFLTTKKLALEKQTLKSAADQQPSEPAENYDELRHASVKSQITEAEQQLPILTALLSEKQSAVEETNKKLSSRATQFTLIQLKVKISALAAKADDFKRQISVAESAKLIKEDMQTALLMWKPEADVIFRFLEAEIKISATQAELKAIQADKAALKPPLKELEEELSLYVDVKSLDELSVQNLTLEDQEVSLGSEVTRLQLLIDNNAKYAQLKSELDQIERALECSCTTNHRCDEQCSICAVDGTTVLCKQPAGHDDGTHICAKEQHDCPEECETCGNRCMYAAGHVNPATHKCSSTHQCTAKCRYCPNTCVSLVTEIHDDHRCNERHCPKRCIFCGGACTGEHDHDVTTVEVPDPKACDEEGEDTLGDPRHSVKLHLCGKEHRCQQRCEAAGVCEVHFVEETRYLAHPQNPLEYQYIRPVANRKKCMCILPPGEWMHKEAHSCKSEGHICDQRCIQCGTFCRETFDHPGEHMTSAHRNMEFVYCVAKTSDGRITVEEDTVGGKKALHVYEVGDALVAETCVQQCKRKGRAHFHLIPCRGGDQCGEKLYGSGVAHCRDDERFFPDTDVVYDKYLCRIYWRVQNWAPPTDDDSVHICNYYCPSGDHPPTERHFCTLKAWHLKSELAKDHVFDCGHDFTKCATIAGMDICFCIDATGSMGSYITACQTAIRRIIADTASQVTKLGLKSRDALQFAVVAYRDHEASSPSLLENSGLTSDDRAAAFIDTIRATGGGDNAEAVLDGLDAAVKLPWRDSCTRVLIHICDCPPHGRQYGEYGDDHPSGCPCGKTDGPILTAMKDKRILYHVVPLTNYVNKMIQVFEKQIPVVRKELTTGAVDLPALASNIACKAMEDVELTASRPL